VDEQQAVEGRQLAHRHPWVRQGRELRDPAVEQEALDAEHPGLVQRAQLALVARDRAAPEGDVDRALPVRGLPLDLECGHVDGGRQRVQRHVDDRRDGAGRGGAGGGGEALPLGATGLVDVHVGVDQAGDQHLVGGRPDLGRVHRGVEGQHRLDPAVLDEDGGRSLDSVDDRARRAEHRPHVRPSW
jgi:hypothetical protein